MADDSKIETVNGAGSRSTGCRWQSEYVTGADLGGVPDMHHHTQKKKTKIL